MVMIGIKTIKRRKSRNRREVLSVSKLILCFSLLFLFQNSCGQTNQKSDGRDKPGEVNKPIETNKESETNKPSEIMERQEKQENKKVSDREKLAEKVEKTDEDTAQIIRDEDTEISLLDTPFLRNARIYRLKEILPTKPVMTYLGCINEKDFCVTLNANPKGFFELIEKAGVLLEKQDLRVKYAEVYLETVESKNKRFDILQSVKDIEPRPGLTDEEKQKFEQFQTKYAAVITAPQATNSFPSTAVFFVVKEQNLVKIELVISPDGKIQMNEIVLEKDLLIPYSL